MKLHFKTHTLSSKYHFVIVKVKSVEYVYKNWKDIFHMLSIEMEYNYNVLRKPLHMEGKIFRYIHINVLIESDIFIRIYHILCTSYIFDNFFCLSSTLSANKQIAKKTGNRWTFDIKSECCVHFTRVCTGTCIPSYNR